MTPSELASAVLGASEGDPVQPAPDASLPERATAALEYVYSYGQIDGSHHKAWVLDQVVRCLLGPEYDAFVISYCAGEDGPETYDWDPGIAP